MHGFANPARFLRIARRLTGVAARRSGCVLIAAGRRRRACSSTPPDRLQGETVRILYVHVPAAWLGMAGWTAIAAAVVSSWSGAIRWPRSPGARRAVPGAVFAALCLATGSLWGRPAWGTWWEWDGRLTSMLVLLFLYFGYIALAAAERERGGEPRIPAIFGLVGAINIPIIHYSVLWWNTLHQAPSHQHRRRLDASRPIPVAAAADVSASPRCSRRWC